MHFYIGRSPLPGRIAPPISPIWRCLKYTPGKPTNLKLFVLCAYLRNRLHVLDNALCLYIACANWFPRWGFRAFNVITQRSVKEIPPKLVTNYAIYISIASLFSVATMDLAINTKWLVCYPTWSEAAVPSFPFVENPVFWNWLPYWCAWGLQ